MSNAKNQTSIESYKFHHIDTDKCKTCSEFTCEEACFRGVYEVKNKNSEPKCIVLDHREDFCVKCHICTSVCKLKAITID